MASTKTCKQHGARGGAGEGKVQLELRLLRLPLALPVSASRAPA